MSRSEPMRHRGVLLGLGGWLVVIGALAGISHLPWLYHRLILGSAAPFVGDLRPRVFPGLLPAIAFAVALLLAVPYAARLSFRRLLLAGWVASAAFAVVLALNDGPHRLTSVLVDPYEYFQDLPTMSADPLRFLRTFTTALPHYAVHTRGHPPGVLVVLWLLRQAGLGGVVPAAALLIAAGSSAVVATALAVREVAGEQVARRAVPFLALAPVAPWVATSFDALFLGVGAWAVALLAIAVRRTGRPRDTAAVGAGLLGGILLFLTYGLLPLGAVALAVVVRTRWRRPLALAVVGMGAVVAGFAAVGFWWPAGFAATHHQYVSGAASIRPTVYFLVADLVVLSVVVGPATLVALAAVRRVRRSGVALLVGAALLAVAVSDLSGYTKGEVERIWLPYTPWLLVANVVHPAVHRRRWLAAQVVTALALQGLVRSTW